MRAISYSILLLEAVLFFQRVLFFDYSIPWDLRGFFLPHALVYADALRAGEWPLWDPFMYCGRPLQANIQAAVFYPPIALVSALGALLGDEYVFYLLELNIVAHTLLAGIFTYWLALALKLSRPSALLAGTAAQMGGFFAVHASHMTAVQVATWIPFTLWCILRLQAGGGTWRYGLLLAAGFAMSILAGLAPLTAVLVALAALLALLVRFQLRQMAVFVAAGLAAVVMTLGQLAPTIELTNASIAIYRSDYLKTAGGIPLQALVSLVMPNYYGVFDPSTYQAPFELTFLYLYCGIPALLLALYALFQIRRNLTWAVMLILTGLAMLGDSTPLGRAVYSILPLKIRIGLHPEYTSAAFVVCLAVMAALGLEQAIKNSRWRWCMLGVCAIDLLAVSSGRPMNAMPRSKDPGISRESFNGDATTLAKLRALAGKTFPPGRFDTANGAMDWAMAAPTVALPTANGNDPFALTRFMQTRLSFTSGERWGSYYEIENLRSPVSGMLNTSYLITRTPLSTESLSGSQFVAWANVPGYSIYENMQAQPRFWLVSNVRRAGSQQEAITMLRAPDFRPAVEAVVEGEIEVNLSGKQGSVMVTEYGMNRLKLTVSADQPAFLASSEVHYPGWQATLDGKPWPLYFTNVAFRGLAIPAGEHVVEMRFNPGLLWSTGSISLAGWLAWIVLWFSKARGSDSAKLKPGAA